MKAKLSETASKFLNLIESPEQPPQALRLGRWEARPNENGGYDIFKGGDDLAWAPNIEDAKEVISDICRRSGMATPKGEWKPVITK